MNLLLMQVGEILEEITLLSVQKFTSKQGIHIRLLALESQKIPLVKIPPVNIFTTLSLWTILHLV